MSIEYNRPIDVELVAPITEDLELEPGDRVIVLKEWTGDDIVRLPGKVSRVLRQDAGVSEDQIESVHFTDEGSRGGRLIVSFGKTFVHLTRQAMDAMDVTEVRSDSDGFIIYVELTPEEASPYIGVGNK